MSKDIYIDENISSVVSFYACSPLTTEYGNVKLSIPASGMHIQSNISDIVEIYSSDSPFFTDRCYRGDFDFDVKNK